MNTKGLSAIASTRIHKPPSQVFDAFADADSMSKFWFTRRDPGLKEGEKVEWFVGNDEDAFSFDVCVKEIRKPNSIVIEWIGIEESGYAGSSSSPGLR